jgi:hypothetical protein
VELSRDEDSVTSLAVVHSSETAAIVLAGINSSTADQQSGKNEHLRSFRLGYPPRRSQNEEADKQEERGATKAGIETAALGKASLFTPATTPKKETYQRLLRLSRTNDDPGPRLGAIATGLAPAGEIVVFDPTTDSPGPGDVRKRIQLTQGEEAADLDLVQSGEGVCLVAYCTDYDVYVSKVYFNSKAKDSEPRFVHGTPHPDVFATAGQRPTFRSLRFLTPTLIILLQNLPGRSGAQVLLLELPGTEELGVVVLRKVLHRSIKSASALATTLLPAAHPSQNVQHAMAIAGQDISITVLTLDHLPGSSGPLKLRTHTLLRNVHPLQMTALALSTFLPPSDPSNAPPQYLKLASTSMSSTVIVHTFPLIPYPAPSRKQTFPSRYVLQPPGAGETAQMGFSILVSIIVVALGAFVLQAWTEIRGGTPEYLGAKGWLSRQIHDYVALPYMFEGVQPVITTNLPKVEAVKRRVPGVADIQDSASSAVESIIDKAEDLKAQATSKLSLRSLLSQRHTSSRPLSEAPATDKEGDDDDNDANDDNVITPNPSSPKHLLVRHDGQSLSALTHHDADVLSKHGKSWDELPPEEKKRWRERLIDAGEWAVEEGETVLKGVFFSELGGAVGNIVAGVVGAV